MTNGSISTFDHPAWTAKILFVSGGLAIGLGARLFFLAGPSVHWGQRPCTLPVSPGGVGLHPRDSSLAARVVGCGQVIQGICLTSREAKG